MGKIHSGGLAPAGVIVIQNLDILFRGDGKPIIGIDRTLEEWLWVLHINIQGKLKGNSFDHQSASVIHFVSVIGEPQGSPGFTI